MFLSKRSPLATVAVSAVTVLFFTSACHRSPPPPPDHPQLAEGVAMRDITFSSAAMGRAMSYRVFLPAHPRGGQKFPVIYLLHGGGGSFLDWSNDSPVSAFAHDGFILVMPEGDSSYFMNEVGSAQDRYADYITHDLITDVEARFPASTGRECRAIVGVSMGGFAAIEYALTRPDLFAFVGAISPAVDVPGRRFSWRRADQSLRFRKIFGPIGSAQRNAMDPFKLVQTADPKAAPYIYMTAGEQEPMLDPIRRFAEILQHRGFAYEFHTRPGGHDWSEWDAQIPGCFANLEEFIPAGEKASHRPGAPSASAAKPE